MELKVYPAIAMSLAALKFSMNPTNGIERLPVVIRLVTGLFTFNSNPTNGIESRQLCQEGFFYKEGILQMELKED